MGAFKKCVGIPHLVNNISTKQIGGQVASAGAGGTGWLEEWDDDDDGIIFCSRRASGTTYISTLEYLCVLTDGDTNACVLRGVWIEGGPAWTGGRGGWVCFFVFFVGFSFFSPHFKIDPAHPPMARCVGRAPFLLLPPQKSR